MREITVREWFEIKKQRDAEMEAWASTRKLGRCACGGLYSFDPSFQEDPGKCAGCRNEEGELVGEAMTGQKRTD